MSVCQSKRQDISIHPPRAGRDDLHHHADLRALISIHPPRAGRDFSSHAAISSASISIHPPRAGRDSRLAAISAGVKYFNPPAPCGAGLLMRGVLSAVSNFNPPAPCGAGPRDSLNRQVRVGISIHPPHAGRDFSLGCNFGWREVFQSTRPVRGGTSLQRFFGL